MPRAAISSSRKIRREIMDEFFPAVLEKGHGEIDVRFRIFKTGEARWMAYKVLTLTDARGRPVAFATVSQDVTERRRLEDNLRAAGRRPVRGRPAQERISRHAGARAAQSAGAAVSNVLEVWKRADGRRRNVATRARHDGAAAGADGSAGRRSARPEPHHAQSPRAAPSGASTSSLRSSRRSKRRARSPRRLGHDLSVELPAEPIYLSADPARLHRCSATCSTTRCKYTDTGGTITLDARSGTEARPS